MLHWSQQAIPVQVLVDSGADDNFIDSNLVECHGLQVIKLEAPKEVLAIDSRQLEVVTHKFEPLKLTLSGNHQEVTELYIIQSPLIHILLGLPWLKTHNPHIDWTTSTIPSWSNAHCLHSAIPEKRPSAPEPPEEIDLTFPVILHSP